jgi:hypothetical protein
VIVKQIWTGNAYRNFNYLIACPETGEALAVDPLDHEKCRGAAKNAPCSPIFTRHLAFFAASLAHCDAGYTGYSRR